MLEGEGVEIAVYTTVSTSNRIGAGGGGGEGGYMLLESCLALHSYVIPLQNLTVVSLKQTEFTYLY